MFEKKRGKRFLASVMALVMLLSLAPVGTLAAENGGQPAENQPVVQPAVEGKDQQAEGKDQQAAVDEDKNTPTPQPAEDPKPVVVGPVESSSEADILPEGDLFDQAFGVNHGTSNSNDIAEHKGGNEGDRESVTTDSTTEYVIRFYVSNTGTKKCYTEDNKYGIAGQPNSTIVGAEGGNTVTIMVSPDYAILTQCNDVAKDISTEEFKAVKVTGDTDVRAWLNKYAEKKVPAELTDRNNVSAIVNFVNTQYNNSGKDLPTLDASKFNGFRFVDAHYVNSGECSIHVHVQLIKDSQYIVQYDPNGGDGAMVDENLYFTGDQATVKANEFTRTGYTFAGWNTEADGSGTSYNPNGDNNKVTIGTGNVTLYAQWTPQTYRINYELYSGTNATINPTGYTYGEGVSSFAPATKDNYNFEGWYSEPEFENKVESISTTDTGDKTLYAHWTEEPATKPATTDVYVYFKMVDAAGKNIKDKSKINNDALKNTAYNNDADKKTWATLGKIASAETLTDGTEYKGTNTTLVTVGNEAKDQLKNDGALHTDNKTIASTVLANIEWFQLKQWAGATDYVPDGSRWHLDGKITGYTVTYNNGTTEATDAVHNMPDADEMYYLRGSEYTVSDATPTRTGYVFTGWKSNIENDTTIYNAEGKFEMPAKNVVLTAQWAEDNWKDADETTDPTDADSENGGDGIPDRYQVKILYVSADQTKGTVSPLKMEIKTIKDANNNFVSKGTVTATGSTATVTDASLYEFVKWTKDTNEVGTNAQLENYRIIDAEGGHTYTFTANFKDKEIELPTSEKAQYTVKHYKWDTQKKNYTFDSEETINSTVGTVVTATAKTYDGGYILNEQKSAQTMSGTVLKDNTLTLKLYYDIDKIGDGENKDQPDGIPDRYQVTVNYVSSNTNWGSVNRSKEVITLSNKESGKWLETGTVIAPSCTATSAGGKCYFVNWTKKQEGTTDVSTVDSTANLPEQTIENAKGGDVYTFTANFDRSSGGSGGSSRPTVTIPDNVPTGLNGKDHYAYIIGYGNNDVRPQNNITRAEVATIFFRLLTDETRTANMTKSNSYNDVKDGDWFCCAVSTLSKMGIIKGYEDGSFKPNDPISRAEFAAIAARFDPDGDKTPASFADVTSHWAKDEISIAANHGWIKGYEDGSFKPDQKITRAETMTLVNRVLKRLPETKDDLHKDMKTWPDNQNESAWFYLAVQEATNSHYFKNKTSTKFEQWTDLRDTRDWSELEK